VVEPSPVVKTVPEIPAEKEQVTISPSDGRTVTNPGVGNDGQTGEEERKNLFAGTGMANDASYQVAEPDSGTAGALEELAEEYMIRAKSRAPKGGDAEE